MSLLSNVTAASAARSEQRRLDADAQVERDAKAAQLALQVEAARRESARLEQLAAEQARTQQDAARAERKAAATTRSAQAWRARAAAARRVGEAGLWIGPILAPMAVAWVGQVQFAIGVLRWPIWAAVVFAAAFELTTAYVARLDFMARHDGDSGIIFRAATWMFALIAAAMNYAHHAGPNLAPTGAAVAYGLMSLTGIALWELLSLYRHRKHLRATGLLPAPLPRFGLARWLNFPAVTWMARRLAIRDGHTTVHNAWQASTAYWAGRKADRQAARTGTVPPVAPGPDVRVDDADKPQPNPRPTPRRKPDPKPDATTRVLAALHDHPDATQAEIARIARTTDRTVRRVTSGIAARSLNPTTA